MKSYRKLPTHVTHAPGPYGEEEEEEEDEGNEPGSPPAKKTLSPRWQWLGVAVIMGAGLLGGTFWAISVRRLPVEPPGKCISVPESQRFDCYPERDTVVTPELCQTRGCCFLQSSSRGGPPWCFYPPDFPSYTLKTLNRTELGFLGVLMRTVKTYYPHDVLELQLQVDLETDTRLHIKLTDPNNSRYEVPLEVPSATKKAENPLYSLDFSRDPFGILVKRRGSGVVLLNTTVAPLIFADQFLQISALLPSAFLYGLGEHRRGFLHHLDWTTLSFWARDVPPTESYNLYGVHPFYLSMEEAGTAHGVFLLNSNAMEVVLQPAPALTWRTVGGILDFYIFLGPDPSSVVQQYQQVIGFPTMPPFWGLGFHLCRWGYGSSNQTWQTVKNMRNYLIPQDAQWNDIDYMEGSRDFTVDPEHFGTLPQLVMDLHKHGQYYVLILDPAISSSQATGTYAPYDEGLKKGIFINNTQGQPLIGQVWPGLTAFPDFSNPETHQWWLQNLNVFHARVPFDGLWIAQDPVVFSPPARTAMKEALMTRYALLPYLYTLFHHAHRRGDTVARPLFFEFPQDRNTYALDQQFLWGRNLLVTPVLEPSADAVIGYFPSGVWYDYYTGSSLQSQGEKVKLAAPLNHINVHIREGAVLPTQKPDTTSWMSGGNPLLLVAALSQEGMAVGDLFWDDGQSLDTLERGNYSYVVFNVSQNVFTSSVLHYNLEAIYITVDGLTVYGVQKQPQVVTANGQEIPFSYLESQVLSMSGLNLNLSRSFSIKWI
ncbi:lysosomal alpha-glucosidase-like isoform X3 [Phascolarctos cinereus]